MDELVLSQVDGDIATLTLNKPASRNCLSRDMMGALIQALEQVGGRDPVKVVILAANGPVFCSGHDLKEMQAAREQSDRGEAFYKATFEQCCALMNTIIRLRQPVIAQVQGMATAAGCQLVATCDLAVAAHNARFATPGVNIGLFCSTPMVALSRNVPRKHAMEMLLTGEAVDAVRARELGLVNQVVAPVSLESRTRALARRVADKSPTVVSIGKEAFYAQAEMDLDAAYAYTAEVMTRNMMARDAAEGIGAFIEKRQPEWSDRDH